MEISIPNRTGYITSLHGGNYPEDGSKNLVESRSFLIIWDIPHHILLIWRASAKSVNKCWRTANIAFFV